MFVQVLISKDFYLTTASYHTVVLIDDTIVILKLLEQDMTEPLEKVPYHGRNTKKCNIIRKCVRIAHYLLTQQI